MKIINKKNIPLQNTSHIGAIKKQLFIEKGTIPQLMNFSTATLKPNENVEEHKHKTMFEVFYIETGAVEFIINNEKHIAEKGDCITIEPNELHSLNNPFKIEATLLYFGIATD